MADTPTVRVSPWLAEKYRAHPGFWPALKVHGESETSLFGMLLKKGVVVQWIYLA